MTNRFLLESQCPQKLKANKTCFFDIKLIGGSSDVYDGIDSNIIDPSNLGSNPRFGDIRIDGINQITQSPQVSVLFRQIGNLKNINNKDNFRIYISNVGSIVAPSEITIPSNFNMAKTTCSSSLKINKTCFYDFKLINTDNMQGIIESISLGQNSFNIKLGNITENDVSSKCNSGSIFNETTNQCELNQTVDEHLILDYPLNGSTINEAAVSTIIGHPDLMINGSVSIAGGGVGFKTPTSSLSTILPSSINLGSNNFSIEFDLSFPTKNSEQAIFEYGENSSGSLDFMVKLQGTGNLWVQYYDVNLNYNIDSLINDKKIHHLSFSRISESSLNLIIDNVVVAAASINSSSSVRSGNNLVIGNTRDSSVWAHPFQGTMFNVKMYNRAYSDTPHSVNCVPGFIADLQNNCVRDIANLPSFYFNYEINGADFNSALVDSSVGHHNLTASGTFVSANQYSQVTGGIFKTFGSHGINDYLYVDTSIDHFLPDNLPITFMAEVSFQPINGDQSIFQYGDSDLGSLDALLLLRPGGQNLWVYFGGYETDLQIPSYMIADYKFHQIALSRDSATQVSVYIDGSAIGGMSIPVSAILRPGKRLVLGNKRDMFNYSASPFGGFISNFRVYPGGFSSKPFSPITDRCIPTRTLNETTGQCF